MKTFSDEQLRRQADFAEGRTKRKTATFQFDEQDTMEIERLEAEGFRFAAITMRDPRGYERAFKVWIPPQSDAGGDHHG
jgi:hypothetical protein